MDYTWEKAQDFAKTSKTSNGRPKGSQKSDFSTHLSKIFPSNLRENGAISAHGLGSGLETTQKYDF
jgi:hypothetical protein